MGCPYRNLYPAVLVMQSAEDWLSSELAEPLDRSMARRILAQGQMRSECVVIAGVVCKDSAQVGFAEDDSVIKAFPANRADQSLRMPVLPGRPRGGRVIAYTHGRKTLRDRRTVGRVPVSDQVVLAENAVRAGLANPRVAMSDSIRDEVRQGWVSIPRTSSGLA